MLINNCAIEVSVGLGYFALSHCHGSKVFEYCYSKEYDFKISILFMYRLIVIPDLSQQNTGCCAKFSTDYFSPNQRLHLSNLN